MTIWEYLICFSLYTKKEKKNFRDLEIYPYDPAGGCTYSTVAINDQEFCRPYLIL
jgi:hypothetical protein